MCVCACACVCVCVSCQLVQSVGTLMQDSVGSAANRLGCCNVVPATFLSLRAHILSTRSILTC